MKVHGQKMQTGNVTGKQLRCMRAFEKLSLTRKELTSKASDNDRKIAKSNPSRCKTKMWRQSTHSSTAKMKKVLSLSQHAMFSDSELTKMVKYTTPQGTKCNMAISAGPEAKSGLVLKITSAKVTTTRSFSTDCGNYVCLFTTQHCLPSSNESSTLLPYQGGALYGVTEWLFCSLCLFSLVNVHLFQFTVKLGCLILTTASSPSLRGSSPSERCQIRSDVTDFCSTAFQ